MGENETFQRLVQALKNHTKGSKSITCSPPPMVLGDRTAVWVMRKCICFKIRVFGSKVRIASLLKTIIPLPPPPLPFTFIY